MNELWGLIEKYPKLYILILSAFATIILFNETLSFTDKVLNKPMLLLFSWLVFGFFAWFIIKEKLIARQRKYVSKK